MARAPIQARPLCERLPLAWHQAQPRQAERAQVARYAAKHHYRGYPEALGQMHYPVRDPQDPVGSLSNPSSTR